MNWLEKSLVYTGLFGICAFGCNNDPGEGLVPEEKPTQEKDIYSNVQVLEEADLEKIDSISENFVYFSNFPEYKKGDVIVGGISKSSPGGILRRVEFVEANKIKTSPASLEEVVKEGEFVFSGNLLAEDLEENMKLKKGRVYDLHYPIENVVIFDLDGDETTKDDQIIIDGDFNFSLNYFFEPKFDEKIKQVKFGTKLEEVLELEVRAQIAGEIKEDKVLYVQKFSPIVCPSPLSVPLVLVPKLEIHAGVEGTFAKEIKSNIYQKILMGGEVEYINGKWNNSNNFDPLFEASFEEVPFDAKVRAYVYPELSLILNAIAGPKTQARGFLDLEVNTNKNPWWEIYGGANLNVGVDMGLLSFFIKDYDKEIISHRELICSAKEGLEKELFFEDFEKYKEGEFPSDWIGDGNFDSKENGIFQEGQNKFLGLYGKVSSCWGALAYHKRDIEPPYNISVRIKNGEERLYGCHPERATIGLRDGDSWLDNGYFLALFDKDGNLLNSKRDKIGKFPLNEWYLLELKYGEDVQGRQGYDYFIDGEYLGFYSVAANKLKYENFELCCNEGRAFFDDFKVTKEK